jgi:hypothetical protein
MQRAVAQLRQPVEQQLLDADVVVEPLQVAQPVDAAQGVRRELRRAMAGELRPDLSRLGNGLEFKRAEAERYAI